MLFMKLNDKEFKRFKELLKLKKSGKISDSEQSELDELSTKKADGSGPKNDPVYYNAGDKSMLGNVASFSFGTYPGQKFRYGSGHPLAPSYGMIVRFTPVIGINEEPSDPVNIAGRKNYAYVRSKNSGAKNYEHPDLTIYNIAYDNLILAAMYGARALRMVQTFSIKNKTLPHELLNESGFSWADIAAHLPSYKARLQLLCKKMGTLVVPSGQMIINRWSFLVNNVFIDGNSDKATWILCVPTQFYKYNPTVSKTGGCLEPVFIENLASFSNYLDELEAMIDAVVADDDCAMMSGDQLKAYGDANALTYFPVDLDEPQKLVYSEDFLLQLHNAMCIGDLGRLGNTDFGSIAWTDQASKGQVVYQGELFSEVSIDFGGGVSGAVARRGVWIHQVSGNLVCKPYICIGTLQSVGSDYDDDQPSIKSTITHPVLLDTWKDSPTPEDVMEMTRFNYGVDLSSDLHGIKEKTTTTIAQTTEIIVGLPLLTCGTELLNSVTLVTLECDTGVFNRNHIGSVFVTPGGSYQDDILAATVLSNVDWHQAIYNSSVNGTYIVHNMEFNGTTRSVSFFVPAMDKSVLFDTQNYTTINMSDHVKLNNLAVFSELLVRVG